MPIKFGTRDEPDYEVYLHRIGRAGRFGRKGEIISLVLFCPKRKKKCRGYNSMFSKSSINK
jgi:superfamily II DNA/RNA helicase